MTHSASLGLSCLIRTKDTRLAGTQVAVPLHTAAVCNFFLAVVSSHPSSESTAAILHMAALHTPSVAALSCPVATQGSSGSLDLSPLLICNMGTDSHFCTSPPTTSHRNPTLAHFRNDTVDLGIPDDMGSSDGRRKSCLMLLTASLPRDQAAGP
jgi:hypothetical protein